MPILFVREQTFCLWKNVDFSRSTNNNKIYLFTVDELVFYKVIKTNLCFYVRFLLVAIDFYRLEYHTVSDRLRFNVLISWSWFLFFSCLTVKHSTVLLPLTGSILFSVKGKIFPPPNSSFLANEVTDTTFRHDVRVVVPVWIKKTIISIFYAYENTLINRYRFTTLFYHCYLLLFKIVFFSHN